MVIRRLAAGCLGLLAAAAVLLVGLGILLGVRPGTDADVQDPAVSPTPEPTPTAVCVYQLGFAAFHDAAPSLVGDCLENEQPDAATGNTTQRTTQGLLVWRRADGLVAFTDGHRSWVRGPDGAIRARRNDERFPFEAAPPGTDLRVVPPGPTFVADQPAAGTPPKEATPPATATGIGNGTHIVGTDVAPATYRSANPGPGCYWARLSGLGGTVDEIIANENAAGAAIVAIAADDRAFVSTGCAPWLPASERTRENPGAAFGSGTFAVGADVAPGTWRAPGGAGCYWARLRSFTGTVDAIIANESRAGPVVAEISSGDAGFTSSGCGTWTRVQ